MNRQAILSNDSRHSSNLSITSAGSNDLENRLQAYMENASPVITPATDLWEFGHKDID